MGKHAEPMATKLHALSLLKDSSCTKFPCFKLPTMASWVMHQGLEADKAASGRRVW